MNALVRKSIVHQLNKQRMFRYIKVTWLISTCTLYLLEKAESLAFNIKTAMLFV